jgi:hypothetical protein
MQVAGVVPAQEELMSRISDFRVASSWMHFSVLLTALLIVLLLAVVFLFPQPAG